MYRYFTGLRLALSTMALASALFAQRDLSTLAGTITDSSGGVVANAKVTTQPKLPPVRCTRF